MNQVQITFPDGNVRSYPQGITGQEIAESISPQFAKRIYAARYNGENGELRHPLTTDTSIEFLDFSTEYGREVFWHSSAHIMAQAIKRTFPEAKLGFGPNTDDGFFYDIELEHRIAESDMAKIELEVKKIIKEEHPIVRKEISKDEAVAFFKEQHETLKAEHIEEIHGRGDTISVYTQGDFTDLCAGPHLPNTKKISKYFKLLSVSGAYWKGKEDRPMLQRIYATAFPSKEELAEYLERIEEAKRRDHRKLGKELKLFSFHGDVAAASPFFLPKGTVIYNGLMNYMRDLYKRYNYDEVITPQILDVNLWHTSGHYQNYKDNMYFTTIDEREFAVKPMNCPTHALIYSEHKHSYRDLPIRLADFGRLHRYEKSGATHGLTRVRTFCQDDAHIFCSESQIKSEVASVIAMINEVYETFDFNNIIIELSTRPEKSVGSDEMWEKAETALKDILIENKIDFEINEGDGAFYGPKIDFQVRDALGRSWQLGTVQLDFSMPERFELEFQNTGGDQERPVMIHRALLGSLERFIGILIEHYAGNFPLWLAPTQLMFIPIADRHVDYCESLSKYFKEMDIRTEVDARKEKMGFKIREAELSKIPYMIVVGDKEMEALELAVRHKHLGDIGTFTKEELASRLRDEIKNKNAIELN
jgi:threonyl-tRNA synthetase